MELYTHTSAWQYQTFLFAAHHQLKLLNKLICVLPKIPNIFVNESSRFGVHSVQYQLEILIKDSRSTRNLQIFKLLENYNY